MGSVSVLSLQGLQSPSLIFWSSSSNKRSGSLIPRHKVLTVEIEACADAERAFHLQSDVLSDSIIAIWLPRIQRSLSERTNTKNKDQLLIAVEGMPLLLETIWLMITVRTFNVSLCLFWNHEKVILLPYQVDMHLFRALWITTALIWWSLFMLTCWEWFRLTAISSHSGAKEPAEIKGFPRGVCSFSDSGSISTFCPVELPCFLPRSSHHSSIPLEKATWADNNWITSPSY